MENTTYRVSAPMIKAFLLKGEIGDVYEYAKRHKEMNAACDRFCQVMESLLDAADVMATIQNEYIWKAFYGELRETERELWHIKDDYIGEVDLDE